MPPVGDVLPRRIGDALPCGIETDMLSMPHEHAQSQGALPPAQPLLPAAKFDPDPTADADYGCQLKERQPPVVPKDIAFRTPGPLPAFPDNDEER
jgi:hypothetical protein